MRGAGVDGMDEEAIARVGRREFHMVEATGNFTSRSPDCRFRWGQHGSMMRDGGIISLGGQFGKESPNREHRTQQSPSGKG